MHEINTIETGNRIKTRVICFKKMPDYKTFRNKCLYKTRSFFMGNNSNKVISTCEASFHTKVKPLFAFLLDLLSLAFIYF